MRWETVRPADNRSDRSHVFGQRLGHLFGCCHRGEPGHDLTVDVDQELLEVPCDVGGFTLSGLLSLQPLVEVAGIVAVDIDLGKNREIDLVVVGDELTDLFCTTGLLIGKLIAWKCQDLEAVGFVVERTQTCVLRRKASKARDVDYQAGGAGEVGEVDRLPFK